MSRVNLEDNKAYGLRLCNQVRGEIMRVVPADNFVLDPDAPFYIIMDPAGAVDILMPASDSTTEGLMFLISNASANAITFKTSGDAAFTSAIVLAGQETSLLVCTGHATAALGWRAIGTALAA